MLIISLHCDKYVHKHIVLSILYEEFEDTKRIIKIRKSEKNRQHTDQQKKDKMANNDIKSKHKTTDRATRTPHIPRYL